MRVTEVSVSVHEKRNHPTEYGHRDCSVQIVASVEHLEAADVVARELLGKATAHVQRELGEWITVIEQDYRLAEVRSEVHFQMRQLRVSFSGEIAKRTLAAIREGVAALPADEQAALLEEAEKAYQVGMVKFFEEDGDVDESIGRATAADVGRLCHPGD